MPRAHQKKIEKKLTPDQLEAEYHDLYSSIIYSSSRDAFKERGEFVYVDQLGKDIYEVGVLYDYVVDMKKTTQLSRYRQLLQDLGIVWNDWQKVRTCGATERINFEAAFCESAKVRNKTLKQFISDYIAYCKIMYPDQEIPAFRNHKDKISELLAECSPSDEYRPTPSPKKERYHFKSEIDRHLQSGCYERKEIFNQIDSFIANNPKGFITIEGGPGTGKSWLIARATKHYTSPDTFRCAWHFNRCGSRDTTVYLIQSLFEQLSVPYDLRAFEPAYNRIMEGGTGSEIFLTDVLNYSDQSNFLEDIPLILMIDALDEVDPQEKNFLTGVGNTQSIPQHLPPNVFVIVSSRSFERERYDEPKLSVSLAENSGQQREDIEGFIRQKLSDSSVRSWRDRQANWKDEATEIRDERFVKLLYERSEYTFVYLFYVFQDIDRFDSRTLPKGLDQYYEFEYRRLLGPDPDLRNLRRKILAAILTFQGSVSTALVAAYSGCTIGAAEDMCREMFRIRLIVRLTRESGLIFLHFAHTSFADFLYWKNENRASGDLHSDTYEECERNVAQKFKQYYQIVDSEFSWRIHNSDLRSEFIQHAALMYLKSNAHEELAGLITNSYFCNEFFSSYVARKFLMPECAAAVSYALFLSHVCRVYEKDEQFMAGFLKKVKDILSTRDPMALKAAYLMAAYQEESEQNRRDLVPALLSLMEVYI